MDAFLFMLLIVIILSVIGLSECVKTSLTKSVFCVILLSIASCFLVIGGDLIYTKEQHLCYEAVTTCAINGLQGSVADLDMYNEWLRDYVTDIVMSGGETPDVKLILSHVVEVE